MVEKANQVKYDCNDGTRQCASGDIHTDWCQGFNNALYQLEDKLSELKEKLEIV